MTGKWATAACLRSGFVQVGPDFDGADAPHQAQGIGGKINDI